MSTKPRSKIFYDIFVQHVLKNNGKIISTEKDYVNAHYNLVVECADGHQFEICLNNIKKERWCPLCSARKNERYTKEIAKTWLDREFIKVHPKWLLNEDGNVMELDMYNDELKLAIEYNGIQHYEYIRYFHKSEEDFKKRQADDKQKLELCAKYKVDLIVVPYYEKDIKKFLLNEFNKRNYQLVNLDKEIIIKNELVEKIETKIKEKNGLLVTQKSLIVNRFDPIELQCHLNHIWSTNPSKILSNSWCHTCGLEVSDETKMKISDKIKKYLDTDEGKQKKKDSFIKRSATMEAKKIAEFEKMETKLCSGSNGCNQIKSVDSFHKRGEYSYNTICKDCVSKYKQTRKQKQIEI